MERQASGILWGDICYSTDKDTLITRENAYLVWEDGKIAGVYDRLPEQFRAYPVEDCRGKLIIPGLVDLHIHAPQYPFRGLKMDLPLLPWLNTNAFPEEAKYQDPDYARKAYEIFVADMKKSGTTRACIFASLHLPATKILMELLEEAGLETYVGKVNMDRNCPDYLREGEDAPAVTEAWLEETAGRFSHVKPILTPRFIPVCSDSLMEALGNIQKKWKLPVQSHLSENPDEIALVQELHPQSRFYGDAYNRFGLFGKDAPAVMAHCVHCPPEELEMMKAQGVFVAHCPQSNTNLCSGASPVRQLLEAGLEVGLGSDIAGGASLSIFRAMTDAIHTSKLRAALLDRSLAPLTLEEAFFLGTLGGGRFFGKVGSFQEGFEADVLVLDETRIPHPQPLTLRERLERYVYLAGDDWITSKYVKGRRLF